jgi:Cu+-exporting ATPase
LISLGSKKFIYGSEETEEVSAVYVSVEEKILGRFTFKNHYRENVPTLVKNLHKNYEISVLSGDNAGERNFLKSLLGTDANIYFQQKPEDKLEMVKQLQKQGKKVMMIGDGLNDAEHLNKPMSE